MRGIAVEVTGDEKQSALESLFDKYSSQFNEQGLKYIKAMTAKTALIVRTYNL